MANKKLLLDLEKELKTLPGNNRGLLKQIGKRLAETGK